MQKQFTIKHTNMAKGFAILLLLAYHLFEDERRVTMMGVRYNPFPLSRFLMVAGFGNVCVSIFVFLSSFGIALGLLSQEKFDFAAAYAQATRRFFRLMGSFVILYLSVNLLWGYKFDYPSLYGVGKQGILSLLTDAFGLSMFFNTPTMNETWWYMEIAYLLIFLVPLLTWLVKKVGYPLLLLAFFAPYATTISADLGRYLFVATFGVCAAYGKWPDKLLNLQLPLILQWGIGIAGYVLCILVRQNYLVHEYYIHLVDAPVALLCVYLAAALLGSLPLLGSLLSLVGKHSMNIYLVHTFFYMILWQDYIYRFQYAGVTFLLLLLSSFLYSFLLGRVKERGLKCLKIKTNKASAIPKT